MKRLISYWSGTWWNSFNLFRTYQSKRIFLKTVNEEGYWITYQYECRPICDEGNGKYDTLICISNTEDFIRHHIQQYSLNTEKNSNLGNCFSEVAINWCTYVYIAKVFMLQLQFNISVQYS